MTAWPVTAGLAVVLDTGERVGMNEDAKFGPLMD